MQRFLSTALVVCGVILASPSARAADDFAACRRAEGADAIAACSRLIQASTTKVVDRATAYLARCRALNRGGEYDRAMADCDLAIRLAPKDPGARSTRCWVWTNKRAADKAIADCDEAIRLDPRFSAAYNNRGNAKLFKHDLNGALADFGQAITVGPRNAIALSNRCRVLFLLRDPDKALPDCDAALRLAPKYALAYVHRAQVFFAKRDIDKAAADCEEAIRLDPKSAIAFNVRGNIRRLKNDSAGALADYGTAIKLDPKSAVALGNRGLLHENMGQLDDALADFRAANALAPQQPNIGRRLKRIEHKIEMARAPAPTDVPPPIAAVAPPTERKTKPEVAASSAPAAPTSGTSSAPVAVVKENRVALVIGNSAYANAGKLPNAAHDAEAVAAALRRVGFTTVTLSHDLGREKFNDALKQFADLADRADWAVVYYAGHGLEFGGTNYLVPTDARLISDRDIAFEAIPLDQVLLAVEGARKLRLIVLDACRDNPFMTTMHRSVASRSIGRGLARVEPEGATLVAYAAKAGQVAQDGEGGNSPFVTALIHYLDTPGLEINFLFRKVRDEVLKATGRRQEPFVYGSLPAEAFYFRPQ
jgi:tetratricopeptide (TPR) repeat protein